MSLLRPVRRLPAAAHRLPRPARVQDQAGRGLPRAPRRARRVRASSDHPRPGALRLPEQDGVHRGGDGRRHVDRAPRGRSVRLGARRRALPAPAGRAQRAPRGDAPRRAGSPPPRVGCRDGCRAPALRDAPGGTPDGRGDGQHRRRRARDRDAGAAGRAPARPPAGDRERRPERQLTEGERRHRHRGAPLGRPRPHQRIARRPHVPGLGELVLPDEHRAGGTVVRARRGRV